MSDTPRPIPTRRGALMTLALLGGALFTAIDADADSPVTSTLVPPNPPPSLGSVAYDPNNAENMGINPDQYGYCQICSPQPFTQVAGCANPVGTQNECQAYCHVIDGTPLTFGSSPPHSGNHWPEPERGVGDHTTPVQRGHYVHSMEHGAVIFLYNCSDDCSSDLKVFRAAIAANPCLPIIMTADPDLKSRFAMASWTWTAASDQMFDAASVTCFAKQHAAHGRECPAGGVCPSFNFTGGQCASNPATQN